MDAIQEKAREIGRLVAQSSEYQALRRANQQLADDRETVQLLNQFSALEEEITTALRGGQEPSQEQQEQYEELVGSLQQQAGYQSLVAAQTNFDRLMMRINEEIAKGIEAGEQSRIILP